MCGRYYIDIEEEEMRKIVREVQKNISVDTGEIYPTNTVPVINNKGNAVAATWGFANYMSKRPLINARSETADEKPTFKKCMENGRCLIPVTSYFEWSKDKEKYQFTVKKQNVIYLAGLIKYDKDELPKFVILTREASGEVGKIHHRMPVILQKQEQRKWINNKAVFSECVTEDGLLYSCK